MQQSESSNPQKSMPQSASIENIPIDELKKWVSNAAGGNREYQNGYMNFWLRESTE